MAVSLAVVRKVAVLRALAEASYSVGGAARNLGISRNTVHRYLKRWGLHPVRCGAIQRALKEEENHEQDE